MHPNGSQRYIKKKDMWLFSWHFLSPGPLFLCISLILWKKGLLDSLPHWDGVARFHPHCPPSVENIIVLYTLPCIIGVYTPFWPWPDPIASMALRSACYINYQQQQIIKNKMAVAREWKNWKQNLWRIWSASYPNDNPENFVSLKETGFVVLTLLNILNNNNAIGPVQWFSLSAKKQTIEYWFHCIIS